MVPRITQYEFCNDTGSTADNGRQVLPLTTVHNTPQSAGYNAVAKHVLDKQKVETYSIETKEYRKHERNERKT